MDYKTTNGAKKASISERRMSVSPVTDEINESDVTHVLKVYKHTPSLWAFSAITTTPFLIWFICWLSQIVLSLNFNLPYFKN